MNVVYNGRGYRDVSDDLRDGKAQWEGLLLRDVETDETVYVKFETAGLLVDPTDGEWFACQNVRED